MASAMTAETWTCPVCKRTYTPAIPIRAATCNGGGRHTPRAMTKDTK